MCIWRLPTPFHIALSFCVQDAKAAAAAELAALTASARGELGTLQAGRAALPPPQAAASAGAATAPATAAAHPAAPLSTSSSSGPASPIRLLAAGISTAPAEAAEQLAAGLHQRLTYLQQAAAGLQLELQQQSAGSAALQAAAQQLCKRFRAGARDVRVRALALRSELQQAATAGAAAEAPPLASTEAGGVAGIGLGAAQAVLQHWDVIERLLSELHARCQALPSASTKGRGSGAQRARQTASTGGRRHAERLCKKLVAGLQQAAQQAQGLAQRQVAAQQAAAGGERPQVPASRPQQGSSTVHHGPESGAQLAMLESVLDPCPASSTAAAALASEASQGAPTVADGSSGGGTARRQRRAALIEQLKGLQHVLLERHQ